MIWEVAKQPDGVFTARRYMNIGKVIGTVVEVVRPGENFVGVPYADLRETCYEVRIGIASEVKLSDSLVSLRKIVAE